MSPFNAFFDAYYAGADYAALVKYDASAYPDYATTLLAYKPLVLHKGTLRSFHNQDFIIPGRSVVTSPCEGAANSEEKHPTVECSCGVHMTLDRDLIANFVAYEYTWDEDGYNPITGVFQVLGQSVLDEENKSIRSEKAFFWGVVKPLAMTVEQLFFYPFAYTYHYNPVLYYTLEGAHKVVQQSWKNYSLFKGGNHDA